jgi:type 1 glutamine amidotransferase
MKNALSILTFALASYACSVVAADKKIVLLAGGASHGPGDHEHRAGCLLLKKCLDQVPGITSVVYSNGWPQQASAFDDASAVVIYSDGAEGHPFLQGDRLKVLDGLVKKGVGIGCVHFAVEVPKEKGGREFLSWIGGYFELFWSVNPFWDAEFKTITAHPVTRGVKPFKMRDEWYYHMHFVDEMKGVTPILSAIPPENTRGKPGENSPRGGNPEVQKHKGEPEHLMWVYERPDGGRGFGFTGGHVHTNWANDNFRKLVLNAALWVAKAEVPADGVDTPVSPADFKGNLDPKK